MSEQQGRTIEPSIYERIEITNRRSAYMPVPTDVEGIACVAAWVELMGASTGDIGEHGFRYRNDGGQRWMWVNPGQFMHHYNGVEFDHPNDSAPWDLSGMEYVSGPPLTEATS